MSYFGTKLAVFMLVFGIVFSLSINRTIDNLNKVDFSGQISQDVIDNLKKVNFSEQIGQDDIDNIRSFLGPLKSDDDILVTYTAIASSSSEISPNFQQKSIVHRYVSLQPPPFRQGITDTNTFRSNAMEHPSSWMLNTIET